MTRHTPESDAGKSATLLLNMGGCVGALLGLGIALLLWGPRTEVVGNVEAVGLFAVLAGLLMGTAFNLLVRHRLATALQGLAATAVLESAAAAAAAGMLGAVAFGFEAGLWVIGGSVVLCCISGRGALWAAGRFRALAS